MLQRFNHIDHELCVRAVLKFLNKKWYRPDVQREIQCYAGIGCREMRDADRQGDLSVKMEIVEALAMETENLLETVESDGPEALTELLDPVLVRQRKDGMTGKIRDIAYLCVWHQILEHVAVCALEPLFKARITPWQHASLPGHGDNRLRKQVQWYLRSGMGIQYAVKRDVHHAYGSLQYRRVLAKIREDIPSAKQILKLLDALALMAPGGHLIIGGYLDAWLFNLAMSYAVEDVMSLTKTRRGRAIRLVVRPQVYMDDVCLLGRRLADLKSAFRRMGEYIDRVFSLAWGPGMAVTRFMTVQEEHRRKKARTKAGRGCPALDMGGWLFHKSYTTIRPRVYRVARRCAIRCQRDIQNTGTVNWQRAQRYMSYNGRIVRADSASVEKQYQTTATRKIGGCAIAWHDRHNRKEKMGNDRKNPGGGKAA